MTADPNLVPLVSLKRPEFGDYAYTEDVLEELRREAVADALEDGAA